MQSYRWPLIRIAWAKLLAQLQRPPKLTSVAHPAAAAALQPNQRRSPRVRLLQSLIPITAAAYGSAVRSATATHVAAHICATVRSGRNASVHRHQVAAAPIAKRLVAGGRIATQPARPEPDGELQSSRSWLGTIEGLLPTHHVQQTKGGAGLYGFLNRTL